MTTYTAHFYTEADYAETRIEANAPEQALQRAREIESDQLEILDFQSYDSTDGIEHIEIWSPDRRTVAEWQSDNRRLRLAASDLLEALEAALERLELGNYAGEEDEYIAQARAAIAKAGAA